MEEKGFLQETFTPSSNPQGAPLPTNMPVNNYSKSEDDALYPSHPGVPLTAGEAALLKSIFGDGIETEDIRKHFSEKEKPGGIVGYVIPAQTFGVDCIKFYGAQYAADDYSQTGDIFKYATFIHEMTHIWQNQQRSLGNTVHDNQINNNQIYAYQLTPDTDFNQLGDEQQAKIIEDYARQFLYLKRLPAQQGDTYLPSYTQDANNTAQHSLALLQKVVEDAFPQARITRMALEARLANNPPPPKPAF